MKPKKLTPLVNGGTSSTNANLIKEKPTIRVCLKCDREFYSHSKLNRLCQNCRKEE